MISLEEQVAQDLGLSEVACGYFGRYGQPTKSTSTADLKLGEEDYLDIIKDQMDSEDFITESSKFYGEIYPILEEQTQLHGISIPQLIFGDTEAYIVGQAFPTLDTILFNEAFLNTLEGNPDRLNIIKFVCAHELKHMYQVYGDEGRNVEIDANWAGVMATDMRTGFALVRAYARYIGEDAKSGLSIFASMHRDYDSVATTVSKLGKIQRAFYSAAQAMPRCLPSNPVHRRFLPPDRHL